MAISVPDLSAARSGPRLSVSLMYGESKLQRRSASARRSSVFRQEARAAQESRGSG